MGMLAEARQSFEYALRMNPDLYPARLNLANLLRDQGREAEGIDYLIADRHVIPPHMEKFYTEKVARLDLSFLCCKNRFQAANGFCR